MNKKEYKKIKHGDFIKENNKERYKVIEIFSSEQDNCSFMNLMNPNEIKQYPPKNYDYFSIMKAKILKNYHLAKETKKIRQLRQLELFNVEYKDRSWKNLEKFGMQFGLFQFLQHIF